MSDKVRIRIGNLTMTNHPMHLHGHEFVVTGTDGGPTPKSTRWHEVTTDIAVGQMRQIEFVADEEGDWAFHCHKSHHTMNAMGHDVPTMIGVDHRGVVEADHQADPRLHGDGRARHGRHDRDGDAAARQHRADDERRRARSARSRWAACSPWSRCARDQKPRRLHRTPAGIKHPPGTQAYEWTGALREPARFAAEGGQSMPVRQRPTTRSRSQGS